MAFTPWGMSDSQTTLAPGIISYSTPSHGGIYLDEEHNQKMPEGMRNESGWYEEDCEWAKVTFIFPNAFKPEHVQRAIHTLKNWLPHRYEATTGTKLDPSESAVLRDEIWQAKHKDHLQVICAFGDWQENVPKGMVGVIMAKDGLRINGERYFLVPEDDYKLPFAIEDEKKYEEVSHDFSRLTTQRQATG